MKSWRIFLAIGIIVLFVGIGVFVAGFAMGGWKFGSDFKMQTFTAQEENTSLDLSLSAGRMNVEFYDGENIEVDYPTAFPFRYEVKESGGKLSVAPANNRIHVGWLFWFRVPTITVKIPRGKVMDLKLHLSAGTASVEGGEFGNMNVHLSAGTITLGNMICKDFNLDLSAGTLNAGGLECTSFVLDLSAGSANISGIKTDKINVDLSAGSANLTVAGSRADYTILVDNSAGSCNVSGQQGAVAGKVIDIDLSAGSVNVYFTD